MTSAWKLRRPRRTAPAPEVGFFTFGFVPERWIEQLTEKVSLLDADVKKHYAAKGSNPDELVHGFWPYQQKWLVYVQGWNIWRTAHQTAASRAGMEAEASFAAQREQYNILHTEFVQVEGGHTTARQDKPILGHPPGHETPGGDDAPPTNWVAVAAIGGLSVFAVALLLRRK